MIGTPLASNSLTVKNTAETAPEDKLEVENGGKNLPDVVGRTGMVIGGVEKVIGDDLAVARAPGPWETVRRKRSSAVVVAGAGERLIGGDGSPSQPSDLVVEDSQRA